jgi:hypothetical protein
MPIHKINNINETFTSEKFSDVGMENVFMSRLMHLIDLSSGLYQEIEKKKFSENLLKILFEGLEPAFVSLKELKENWKNQEYPSNKKEKLAKDTINYLVIAYKDRLPKLTIDLNIKYDIGFLFQEDKKFESGLIIFSDNNQKIAEGFSSFIKKDREHFVSNLNNIRNNLIQHSADKSSEEIKSLKEYLNPNTLSELFECVWTSIEDIIIALFIDSTNDKFVMRLYELDEYKMDRVKAMKRLGWFITK